MPQTARALFAGVRPPLRGLVLVAAVTAAWHTAVPMSAADDDIVVLLARVGQYVQRYLDRAGTLISRETVRLQPLGGDLTPDGRARRLEYDLRVEWTPGQDGRPSRAQAVRTLLTVDGRPPKPADEPECMDPRAEVPEPLSLFLPERQTEYAFKSAGTGRAEGRRVRILQFRELRRGSPEVAWKGSCVTVDLPGRSVGRAWIDPDSGEVLRIDEFTPGPVDIQVPPAEQRPGSDPYMVFERSDVSIRYKRVVFHDPEEAVLMPASVETLSSWRHVGALRHRTTQTFTNYRRFVTGARVVTD